MSRLSDRDRAELDYLNVRNDIEELVDRVGYENILKHMIEKLDHIDDLNNTQSMYLFQIISSLEKVLEVYPRLENV
jgi:23S rRNA A1618 N6-methylase RlmF|tara:strand:- start:1295 stop:1522 length:228 start_codon:yes stop_codon:yes gene_type:complete